ncbi:hypothetical protein SUGI_0243350 [Cryptomeria japonica]|nr:hypothetical protein SUGI_0243350 [Cryptomeria japonica]
MNESGLYQEFDLNAEKSIRCWIDFDGEVNSLNVSVVPRGLTRPKLPLISIHLDLLGVVKELMYVSFLPPQSFSPVHGILELSFRMNALAQDLDLSNLPTVLESKSKHKLRLQLEHPLLLW